MASSSSEIVLWVPKRVEAKQIKRRFVKNKIEAWEEFWWIFIESSAMITKRESSIWCVGDVGEFSWNFAERRAIKWSNARMLKSKTIEQLLVSRICGTEIIKINNSGERRTKTSSKRLWRWLDHRFAPMSLNRPTQPSAWLTINRMINHFTISQSPFALALRPHLSVYLCHISRSTYVGINRLKRFCSIMAWSGVSERKYIVTRMSITFIKLLFVIITIYGKSFQVSISLSI